MSIKKRLLLNAKRFSFFYLFLLFCFSSLYATDNNLFRLDGKWELFLGKTPEETFNLIDSGTPADYMSTVPGNWNKEVLHSGGTAPETFGCYRYLCTNLNPSEKYALLLKESPGTSCALYINRKLTGQTGDPFVMLKPDFHEKANAYNPSHSQAKPLYCEFFPDQNGQVEIVFLVSNYFYRKGGLWDSVFLGTKKSVMRTNNITLLFNAFVIGCLFFIGLLNLIQFFINKKRWEYFYLGIASIVFALRIGTADYCSFAFIFPQLTSEVKVKIELLVLWMAPVSVLQMLFKIYPSKNRVIVFQWFKEKHFRHFIIIADLILGLFSLILPAYYANRLVPHLQIGMGIIALYVVIFSISNLIKHKKYALYNSISYSMLFLGAIIDIIYSKQKNLMPISFFPFFLVAFVIVQILMLSAIQNDIYKDTEKSSNELQRLNEAYLRFVPKEFLRLLNKESVIKTKLGDYSNIEMTIMFSKLSFEDSEKDLSLEEHFMIFNEYLKQISPIIKKYDGFVSKFLSGGFMALFPNSEIDAVRAALEIKDCTKKLNTNEITANHKINSWVGIHYGRMIIGTIGEENRLDDTVISDTVNTAARIESVCEKLEKNIIISQVLQKKLLQESTIQVDLTELEAMYVKGKEKPLQLYEVCRKARKVQDTQESL